MLLSRVAGAGVLGGAGAGNVKKWAAPAAFEANDENIFS